MIDNNIDYMVSLDFGKNGAFAYWRESEIIYVHGWDLSDRGKYTSLTLGMLTVLDEIFDIIKDTRCNVVVEKPARHLAYQWVMYEDLFERSRRFRVPFITYMTSSIKKTVTGYGNASKELVEEEVKKIISEGNIIIPEGFLDSTDTEHKWDSIAAGICHLKKIGKIS